MCLYKIETMNKIYNQDALKQVFYTSSSHNGGSCINFKEKKKKSERIVELKKKTKCNYYHEKGHWAKECEKKKEDKEESFANLTKTSGFVTSASYAIVVIHGPTH
jgi:predicted DNA-binding protein (MmcQ/YjbR family)